MRRSTARRSWPSRPSVSATVAAASGAASAVRRSAAGAELVDEPRRLAATNGPKRLVTARLRNGATYGSRWRACSAPSVDSMLGPTTRAVENRGSSTVNVAGSRSTSTAASRPVTSQPPSAGTHATGAAARSRARCGCGSPVRSSIVGVMRTTFARRPSPRDLDAVSDTCGGPAPSSSPRPPIQEPTDAPPRPGAPGRAALLPLALAALVAATPSVADAADAAAPAHRPVSSTAPWSSRVAEQPTRSRCACRRRRRSS